MANRIPNLLAAAVAVVCSVSAHAAENQDIHRAGCGNHPVRDQAPEQYAKVVLYSDVTIAQDSACSWGIWEQLEPTAAGPQTPLPLLAAGGGDRYRPVGVVTTPPTPTPEVPIVVPVDPGSVGEVVGFGVIYPVARLSPEQPQALGREAAPDRQAFKLKTDANSWMPSTLTVSTESIRDAVPAFDNFGPMTLTGGNTHQRDFVNDSTIESGSLITDLGSVTRELPNAPAQLDHFNGELTRYVSGVGPQVGESANSRPSVQVYGVWGVSTPANDMAALLRNDVTVTYNGYMVNEGNVPTGNIAFTAAFGQGTFKATVNGGSDQPGVTAQRTATGQLQLQGRVGFYMNGTITGSTWQATSFSADDLAKDRKRQPIPITGAASGAFIGPQAAAVIGAVDINKSNNVTGPEGKYTNGHYVSSFVAVKQEPR